MKIKIKGANKMNPYYQQLNALCARWERENMPRHEEETKREFINRMASDVVNKGECFFNGITITVAEVLSELEGADNAAVLKMRNPDTYVEGLEQLNDLLFLEAVKYVEFKL